MIKRNQLNVIFNQYQTQVPKVLTVCSAGCLRSPTAAHVLASPPYNFNTRCCGLEGEYAIIPISDALLLWADTILVMETWMAHEIEEELIRVKEENAVTSITDLHCLNIEDVYSYRSPALVTEILEKVEKIFPKYTHIVSEEL